MNNVVPSVESTMLLKNLRNLLSEEISDERIVLDNGITSDLIMVMTHIPTLLM